LGEIAERDAAGKPIEIWFQDEARIGQKNKITRRWARRGTRPSAPHDQRTRSTYIFGAICPARGTGAVFRSYDDILDHCSYAWNKLVDQPWTIMSIGLRDWAHRF
jgi:hypothetical protein